MPEGLDIADFLLIAEKTPGVDAKTLARITEADFIDWVALRIEASEKTE